MREKPRKRLSRYSMLHFNSQFQLKQYEMSNALVRNENATLAITIHLIFSCLEHNKLHNSLLKSHLEYVFVFLYVYSKCKHRNYKFILFIIKYVNFVH